MSMVPGSLSAVLDFLVGPSDTYLSSLQVRADGKCSVNIMEKETCILKHMSSWHKGIVQQTGYFELIYTHKVISGPADYFRYLFDFGFIFTKIFIMKNLS